MSIPEIHRLHHWLSSRFKRSAAVVNIHHSPMSSPILNCSPVADFYAPQDEHYNDILLATGREPGSARRHDGHTVWPGYSLRAVLEACISYDEHGLNRAENPAQYTLRRISRSRFTANYVGDVLNLSRTSGQVGSLLANLYDSASQRGQEWVCWLLRPGDEIDASEADDIPDWMRTFPRPNEHGKLAYCAPLGLALHQPTTVPALILLLPPPPLLRPNEPAETPTPELLLVADTPTQCITIAQTSWRTTILAPYRLRLTSQVEIFRDGVAASVEESQLEPEGMQNAYCGDVLWRYACLVAPDTMHKQVVQQPGHWTVRRTVYALGTKVLTPFAELVFTFALAPVFVPPLPPPPVVENKEPTAELSRANVPPEFEFEEETLLLPGMGVLQLPSKSKKESEPVWTCLKPPIVPQATRSNDPDKAGRLVRCKRGTKEEDVSVELSVEQQKVCGSYAEVDMLDCEPQSRSLQYFHFDPETGYFEEGEEDAAEAGQSIESAEATVPPHRPMNDLDFGQTNAVVAMRDEGRVELQWAPPTVWYIPWRSSLIDWDNMKLQSSRQKSKKNVIQLPEARKEEIEEHIVQREIRQKMRDRDRPHPYSRRARRPGGSIRT
ncbi:hypothetical protein MKEN_00378400 [Mycena kentingensis (nom. inval.)]|nr:hypothetical protein MKEN_00378400 [Mycena kentingensis (nom. inval.)]